MKKYETSDPEIISMYHDYIFLKMNMADFNEELNKIVIHLLSKKYCDVSIDDGIIKYSSKYIINDILIKIDQINTYSSIGNFLKDEDIKIIKSLFNPVMYDNFLRIVNTYFLYHMYTVPYVEDCMCKMLKDRIREKLNNNNSNSE